MHMVALIVLTLVVLTVLGAWLMPVSGT